MNRKRQFGLILIVVLAFLFCAGHGTSAETVYEPNGRPAVLNAQYTSPEGVPFFSYSSNWDAAKLEELSKDLLSNRHGEELRTLKAVRLFHNPSPSHYRGEWKPSTPSGFPASSEIHLYNCVNYTTVKDFSLTLSQEYAYLFTRYWITKCEDKSPRDRTTEWARTRPLDYYPVRWLGANDWGFDYSWDPERILATDYRMMSVHDLEDDSDFGSFLRTLGNTIVPPATSIPEVGEYWSRLTGLDIRTDALQPPRLKEVKVLRLGSHSLINHELVFTPASSDSKVQSRLRYVGAWYAPLDSAYGLYSDGFSRVSVGNPAVRFGPREEGNTTYFVNIIPRNRPVYLRIYAFDLATGQMTYSPMYWYDFADENNPKPAENQYRFISTKFVPHVWLNGAEYALSPTPKMIDDMPYLPLTPLAKLLGWQVNWDAAYKTLTGEYEEHTFAIKHFVNAAFLDGQAIPLEQRPIMGINDLYVPLELAAQLLSVAIDWNLEEETITIKSLPPTEESEHVLFHNPNPEYATPEQIPSPYSGPEPEFQRVTRVALPDSEVTLAPASKYALSGGAEPANADYRAMKWSSSDPSIATVSQSGEVQALKEGVTVVRATSVDGGFYDECTISVVIGAPPPSTTVGLTIGLLEANVNEATFTLDASPYIEAGSGRAMVPLRFVSEALGAGVQWLGATQQILITDRDRMLSLRVGSIELYLNNEPIFMDCTPQNISGRIFVPLRFVSETLGAKVAYDGVSKQLTVTR